MEYKIINTSALLPMFDKELPVFCDIETDDLYGPLRMIQLYQPQTSNTIYILDIAPIGYDEIDYAIEYAQICKWINNHYTVWYNASYDLGTLDISPDRVEDMIYLIKSAYPEFGIIGNKPFALKNVVKRLRYTKGLYSEVDDTKETAKGFRRGVYLSRQSYIYAATDVLSIGLMWEDKKVQLVRENNTAYKVDMLSQHYALQYQQNGLYLDRELWESEVKKARRDVKLFSSELPSTLNPNSYKQVRAYLGTTESDHGALISYALSDKPLAKQAESIINLKRAKKEVSYLMSINFEKMITKFNVAGAISGRFTSAGGSLDNGFNAQQIPRNFQKLFNSPLIIDGEDTIILDADYSTLELRLAATIFKDEAMYLQLKDGRDLHTEMAIQTTGKKLHPDGVIKDGDRWREITIGEFVTVTDRTKAKAINFGFVFGMSAKSFVPYAFTGYGIKYSLDEATDVRNKYFELYKNISKHHQYVWSNFKNPNFIVKTALGRRVKPKLGTDGINIPVQGSGAETTKLAVHYLIKDNPDKPIIKWIYNVVHDAIYLRIPRSEKAYMSKALEDAMLKGWDEIGKTELFHYKDIPMIAEVECYE